MLRNRILNLKLPLSPIRKENVIGVILGNGIGKMLNSGFEVFGLEILVSEGLMLSGFLFGHVGHENGR